jgi:drug/metabolite transporter (DMT)-like permease
MARALPEPRDVTLGYLYALAAALLFGANGSLTKVVLDSGISGTQVTQFRVLGMCVVSGLVLLAVDRSAFRITWRQFGVMVVLGVVGVALLQATYAYAVHLLPVGIALLLEYTAVLMVAVVAFFFLKEQVKGRLWIAIGLVLAGLAVVAQVWSSTLNPLGVLFAIAAAMTLAFYFLVGEHQVSSTSPLAVTFWTGLVATVFWAFLSGWWDLEPAIFAEPVSLTGSLDFVVVPFWMALLWLVVLGSFLPFLLSLTALSRMRATAAGIIASSEVIFAFVIAWLWLGQQLNIAQVIGAIVVLAGIILAQTARANKVVDADLAIAPSGPIDTLNVLSRL